MPKKTNYKKIFIEDLPKWQDGEFEGCINWRAIRNTPVRFQYNDTHGVFIAKYFDKSKERILVEYDGNDIWCHRSTFKRSNISRIIGKIQSGKSIPDIANNLDVSEHTVRRYLSRCYELNICEDYHIRKRGETID